MKAEQSHATYSFRSRLGPKMEEYIAHKRVALDSTFNTQASALHAFDVFLRYTDYDQGLLTKDAVEAYRARLVAKNLSSSHIRSVLGTIRGLAIYLIGQGTDAYLFPKNKLPIAHYREPYIPSLDELKKFAKFVDAKAVKTSKRLHQFAVSYAVIYRLLFLLGLRISEALDLRREEVRFSDNTLYIRNSKGNKDRVVAFNDGLAKLLSDFDVSADKHCPQRTYFFGIDSDGRPCKSAFRMWFKRNWLKCFGDRGRYALPSPHCLRHAYVVHIIDLWAEQRVDFRTRLPILSKSLGHASVANTYYYYHQLNGHGKSMQNFAIAAADIIPQEVRDAFLN